jgi:hypothetical protein
MYRLETIECFAHASGNGGVEAMIRRSPLILAKLFGRYASLGGKLIGIQP